MTNHGDQLREAFEHHENLAPDPAQVYARVQELSRAYKWRRRGVQAAGGAVLSAGLIAGVVTLPSVLPGQQSGQTVNLGAPGAAPSASPSKPGPAAFVPPSLSPSEAAVQKAWDAYFAAGYDYDDAVKLAKLWRSKKEPGDIKAEAGQLLLAGKKLPFAATPNPPAAEEPENPKTQAAFDAFFAAGYNWDDAEKLAKLWKQSDPADAKVTAGQRILDGKKLPFKPAPANVEQARKDKALAAYFTAGYDYADAEELAKIWKLPSATEAKAAAGKKLLAGEKLPFAP